MRYSAKASNKIKQRINAEKFIRFAESIVGKNNSGWQVVVYTMLFLLVAAWLPEGVSDNLEYLLSGSGRWSFNYKLTLSIIVLIIFWLLIRKSGIFNSKVVAYSEQPQPVKFLAIFLSPLRSLPDTSSKSKEELEVALCDGSLDSAMFSGTTWEMPLKAIQFHISRLQKVYLITSSGDKGTSQESPLFNSFSKSLYPDLIIEELTPGGIDFENIDIVFAVVDKFYELFKNEHCRENDVLIDITGGQKTNSIAAAIATLTTGRQFQYLGKQSNEVLSYDVRLLDEKKYQ